MTKTTLSEQSVAETNKTHTAISHVSTIKAERYLKALVNHFNRKVNATYEGAVGQIQFPFGNCHLEATTNSLLIKVASESDSMLARTKDVIADHLIRFGTNEELVVIWQES